MLLISFKLELFIKYLELCYLNLKVSISAGKVVIVYLCLHALDVNSVKRAYLLSDKSRPLMPAPGLQLGLWLVLATTG